MAVHVPSGLYIRALSFIAAGLQLRMAMSIFRTPRFSKQMGGCQNYGPFLGTLNIRGRTIMGTQNGDNHPNGTVITGD